MGLLAFLKNLFGSGKPGRPAEPPPDQGMGIDELARRLQTELRLLIDPPVEYQRLTIPKKNGGVRVLHKPSDALRQLQRKILRRLLARLKAHPAATAFERGKSIVHNAMPHVGKDVVIRMDVRNFFPSTSAGRVRLYFRNIGWNAEAAEALTRLCTYEGGLPQGAPTSPRLANIVNYGLDTRLARFAEKYGADYTRYADDITISFNNRPAGKRKTRNPMTGEAVYVNDLKLDPGIVIYRARTELERSGYRMNFKKLRICRPNNRQIIAGLVVNERVNLPRKTRRRLRAVQHHIETGKAATLTAEQLKGWHALQAMVLKQSAANA